MPTFNIYVPSYKRSNCLKTNNLLEYCTYVVRESEKKKYEDVGVKTIAVDDEQIDSIAKVQNWIIENTPEEVIAILDDDILNFIYRIETNENLTDKETITREIERLGQLCYDLGIGLAGSPIRNIPTGYTAEIHFSGMIGPIRYYNRSLITKSRYEQMHFFCDTDFVLQELLNNRIIFRPDYLVTDAKVETNKGGMNQKRNKAIQLKDYDALKTKWGKYIRFNPKKNVTKILVKR